MHQNENNRDVQQNPAEPAPANHLGSWNPPALLRVIQLLAWTRDDSNLSPDTVALITFVGALPDHAQGPVPISREELIRCLGLTAERIEAATKNAVDADWLSFRPTMSSTGWYLVTVPERLSGFLQDAPATASATVSGCWKWVSGGAERPLEMQCSNLAEATEQAKQLVAELSAGKVVVARLEANMPDLFERISQRLSHSDRLELVSFLYWMQPRIPAATVAALLPGTSPGMLHLHVRSAPSGVPCCKCGREIVVRNRKALDMLRRHVALRSPAESSARCESCSAVKAEGTSPTLLTRM